MNKKEFKELEAEAFKLASPRKTNERIKEDCAKIGYKPSTFQSRLSRIDLSTAKKVREEFYSKFSHVIFSSEYKNKARFISTLQQVMLLALNESGGQIHKATSFTSNYIEQPKPTIWANHKRWLHQVLYKEIFEYILTHSIRNQLLDVAQQKALSGDNTMLTTLLKASGRIGDFDFRGDSPAKLDTPNINLFLNNANADVLLEDRMKIIHKIVEDSKDVPQEIQSNNVFEVENMMYQQGRQDNGF